MKCGACGGELRPGAKFCGSCGTKAADPVTRACARCGLALKPGAKFCGSCGAPAFPAAPESADEGGGSLREAAGYVYWNVLPGQVALKLDETDLVTYDGAKGIVVQDGTTALFFVEGALSAELANGRYEFKKLLAKGAEAAAPRDKKDKKGILGRVVQSISEFFTGPSGDRLKKKLGGGSAHSLAIVLVRNADFPLVFEVKGARTAGIRSDIGLEILCRITDANTFYRSHLLDRKFVSLESLAAVLAPTIEGAINGALAGGVLEGSTPDQIQSDPKHREALASALRDAVAAAHPHLTLTRIVRLEAGREELEAIRGLREELYVSELELAELTRRNAFLNSLGSERNQQLLREARGETDFRRAMDEIDEDRQLGDDERARFALMLESQRRLREAKNEDEIEAAMQGFRRSELLREDEISAIQKDIAHRADLRDLANGQALTLAAFRNKLVLDRQQLLWEGEIGDRQQGIQLERQRKRDSYADERRQREAELEKAEQQSQLEILRQAQAIRLEREAHAHGLEMEKRRLEAEADLELKRVYAAMTFEQIMAVNPAITPQAAQALAEKFKAEGARAASDDKVAMALSQKDEMRSFMEQQMGLLRDVVAGAAGDRGAALEAKDRELSRAREDAERHNDRYAKVVETTVRAVAGQGAPGRTCPTCGAESPAGSRFCQECGASF